MQTIFVKSMDTSILAPNNWRSERSDTGSMRMSLTQNNKR